jgi:hypothetical protein
VLANGRCAARLSWWSSQRAVTNLAVDPLFGAPPASDRLRAASPCRDAGDDGAIEDDTFDVDEDMVTTGQPTPDADLGLRIRDAAADMGAYEHVEPCPLDLDGDQPIGFGELLLILSEWGPCPPPPPGWPRRRPRRAAPFAQPHPG